MADAPHALKLPVPIKADVLSSEEREIPPPAANTIDPDDASADDPDPLVIFSEWADEIDDADFAHP